MEVSVRSVVIFFGQWVYQKEQKWIQTYLLPHYMHLNLEFGRELTVQNWFLLQSVQIPHSGSKIDEFEEFLTNVILFISLSSFWMLTNCSDSPLPLNSGTSKKAHVWLLRSLGASQENPHVFKPPLWGWCKPGELPSGNVMVSCSYRDSGLPSTLPNSAVVSSHGQTGSILSPTLQNLSHYFPVLK